MNYLSNNGTVIITSAATLAELIVIIVNLLRKLKSNINQKFSVDLQSYHLEKKKNTTMNLILWSVNPINLFRKP